MTDPRQLRIAVVGAGIGGLSVAALFGGTGGHVDVFERWPRIKAVGTGIGLWPNAVRVLDRIGVGGPLRAVAVPQPGGALRSADGRDLLTLRTTAMERGGGTGVLLISRERILNALVDAARTAGANLYLDAAPDVGRLADTYDVVVGADGISSTVRTELFGARDPRRRSGFWAVRGTDERTLTPYGEFWGARQLFGVTPIENGATNWYAAMRTDRRPTVGDLRDWYAGWPDPVGALLKSATDEAVLRHEVQHLWPVPKSFVHGNAVLVGDAAHAMPPNLGQGGAQALLDAACLVDELVGRSVPDALAEYDRRRRRTTRRYVAGSIAMANVALAGGRAARVRDRVLHMLPAPRVA
ncbi:FAD-dependent monooxygenase [Solicola gregarius]|uniref:FAD-dependent monooxygenase n=1 Tax=Solicola gregarius TaxID=2908642 RepID=A0AA46TKK7_9ACTN|nr:FAD-dependent monooxygenase [Solicola gregarius]UYM07044.1 FAD-dependent monooxygenase [Solicola gregarius]